MSEMNQADPTKAVEVAQRIVAILVNENSETRRRAIQAAMMLLGEAAPGLSSSRQESEQPDISEEDTDLATFFNRDEKLKPSDHVQLCAAYHFSINGIAAFSLDELRDIARNAGVVLPDRIDKTLNQAAKNGRKLFQIAGRGVYRPTASAGLVFKERWNVKPGKKAKNGTMIRD